MDPGGRRSVCSLCAILAVMWHWSAVPSVAGRVLSDPAQRNVVGRGLVDPAPRDAGGRNDTTIRFSRPTIGHCHNTRHTHPAPARCAVLIKEPRRVAPMLASRPQRRNLRRNTFPMRRSPVAGSVRVGDAITLRGSAPGFSSPTSLAPTGPFLIRSGLSPPRSAARVS
jgi:hypothetical protein